MSDDTTVAQPYYRVVLACFQSGWMQTGFSPQE
jgi:hypothetical protein